MALADLSFKLYNDALLTSVFGGTLQITNYSNLSDGSQDFTYYFGSTASSVQLQAVSSPGVDNITLTPTYILPVFAVSTAYSLGASVTPITANGYRYEVTTAGTTAATSPTWGVVIGGTTTSGTCVFTMRAVVSPTTEIKLANTLIGLNTATGGAALSLGNTITSGVSNLKYVYVRITNTITTVSETYGTPELGININSVQETAV